jgi:hypothetical protein
VRDYGKQEHLRTSLIVQPAQRETAAAHARGAAPSGTPAGDAACHRIIDSAQSRSLAERCISWGNVGPPMIPPTYYANLQIMQTRDQVVIRHELMDGVRVIHMDGRPQSRRERPMACRPLRPAVGWARRSSSIRPTSPSEPISEDRRRTRGRTIFATERLHVIERFTPIDANTIRYEFTVEDPDTWTMPWSGEMSMRRIEGPIYEYACHEGNYGLANILRGARVAEGRRP